MALTVEDGSGPADADAFVSVADCTTYCTDHGLSDWTGATRSPADDDEAAIRRATAWLSNAFTWKGVRAAGRSQALAWPRADVEDDEGNAVGSDEVPVEIVQACCIAAAYERANPGGLSPAVTLTDRVKRERVDSLDVEYASTALTAEAARPILTPVLDVVGGLISSRSNALVGTVSRA